MKLIIPILIICSMAKLTAEEKMMKRVKRQQALIKKRATNRAAKEAERAQRLEKKRLEREKLRQEKSAETLSSSSFTDLMGLTGWEKGLRLKRKKSEKEQMVNEEVFKKVKWPILEKGQTQCFHTECSSLQNCTAESPYNCQEDEVCSLTLRRQRGQVPTRYYFICEKRDSCLANKHNNGMRDRGQCRPSNADSWFVPSTCRQCCTGATCLDVFAMYEVEGTVSQKKWNWNRSLFP